MGGGHKEKSPCRGSLQTVFLPSRNSSHRPLRWQLSWPEPSGTDTLAH